jgi:hypothetical protein
MTREVEAYDMVATGECDNYRVPPGDRCRGPVDEQQRRLVSRPVLNHVYPASVVVVDPISQWFPPSAVL